MEKRTEGKHFTKAFTQNLNILTHLKLPFCYKLINFIKKYFKELVYIYYDECFWWRNLCWVLKKKQHNLGLPTFKMPASTKILLRLTC